MKHLEKAREVIERHMTEGPQSVLPPGVCPACRCFLNMESTIDGSENAADAEGRLKVCCECSAVIVFDSTVATRYRLPNEGDRIEPEHWELIRAAIAALAERRP